LNVIKENEKAPGFTLPNQDGDEVSLADFKGRNVVVYFYPKDSTPGCTTEAIDFTGLKPEFDKANTVIIGMSKDSVKRHRNFVDKNNLEVILASDEDGAVIESYGAWGEKKMYGKTMMGIIRSTFLIDGEGVVRKVWPKVRIKGHAEEVLEAAKAL